MKGKLVPKGTGKPTGQKAKMQAKKPISVPRNKLRYTA